MKEIGGRLKIVSQIGKGGMGTVYKARQTNLNRVVALKVISREALQDEEMTRRFFLEAEIMANLPDNSHVVRVFEMDKAGNVPFYAMEYIPYSLANHVGEYGRQDGTRGRDGGKRPRKLPVKEACEIAEHILEALVFVHENGVFHRDISPENVLLIMKDQDVAAAKLTDFGIAKVVDSGLTTAETSAYKFGYASPEQRVSLSAADARSDVYSTGMVVYRMVIGELPSGVHTRQPMESNPEICPGLNRWILKATMPAPEDRYQSAAEALSELRKIGKCENAPTQEDPEEEQGGEHGQEGDGVPDVPAPDDGQQTADASETSSGKKRKKKKGTMAAAFAAVLLFIVTGALIAFWQPEKSVSNHSGKGTGVDTVIESAPKPGKTPEAAVESPDPNVEKADVEKEEPSVPSYKLRSEPMDVSSDEFKTVFNLDENRRPKRYVENEYEDLGNGVVVDHATGLMWEKSGSPDYITYEKAEAYIRDLNRKKLAGFDDWRLPTVDELASLVEPEERSGGLYIDPPFDTNQSWCWTSDKRGSGSAWYVSFNDGSVYWSGVDNQGYVRAVRARQSKI